MISVISFSQNTEKLQKIEDKMQVEKLLANSLNKSKTLYKFFEKIQKTV